MDRQEGLPARLFTALWRGLDAMIFEDGLDRIARDVMPEVLQGAADARVAPGRVLVRHVCHERGEVRFRARPTMPALRRAVVLRGDQPAVPAQDGIGRHDAGDVGQAPSAEGFAFTARRRRWSSVRRTRWGRYAARRIRFSSRR